MMTQPPKSTDSDELCSMCKRPKSEHTPEEMLAYLKKLTKLEKYQLLL